MRQITGRLVLGSIAAGTAVGVAWLGASAPLRGQAAVPTVATAAVAGGFGGENTGEEPEGPQVVHLPAPPMTAAAARVWLKMQEPLAFNFPNDTPLADVIKYVREATKDPKAFPKGISFYVDPKALQNADKTMASPVAIDLEDAPLATTLKLALAQLELRYAIHPDGFVVVGDVGTPSPEEADAEILSELARLRDEVYALRESLARRPEPAGGGGMSGGMQGTAGGSGGMRSVAPGR